MDIIIINDNVLSDLEPYLEVMFGGH